MATTDTCANVTLTILRALRGNPTNFLLDNSKLSSLPSSLTKLTSLRTFSAKNNQLGAEPHGENGISSVLKYTQQLVSLNLGGNYLTCLPTCLSVLTKLTTLHLFNNNITHIDSDIIGNLQELITLNLNFNHIDEIPTTIKRLTKLKILSIANNKLTYIPKELCQLVNLEELHLEGNSIKKLPYDISKLKKLEKLFVQKNKIHCIPQSIGECKSLVLLDVSSNSIKIFPSEIRHLDKLNEFYYEVNPLIPFIPVPSDIIEEILSLKELISRHLIKILDSDSELQALVHTNSEIKQILAYVGTCAICRGPFLNSWLDCVEFVSTKDLFSLQTPSGIIPLKVVLCSYKCFDSNTHSYYGIAVPPHKEVEDET